MKAALFYGGDDIRVEELPDPRPGPGEVLVAVRAAGICGSDLHRYRGLDPWAPPARFGAADPSFATLSTAVAPAVSRRSETPPSAAGAAPIGSLPPKTPRRAGHEIAGVVAALGAGVEGLAEGQAVVVEPMQLAGCGRCPTCRGGSPQLCPERGRPPFAHRRRASAGFAELDVAAAEHVHPLPEGLPLAVAALADTYACALHALARAPVPPGGTAVIVGTGAVGLALGQLLRRTGGRAVMVGRRQAALAAAQRLGAADAVVHGGRQEVGAVLAELTGRAGACAAFEAVGGDDPTPLRQAVAALAPSGTLVVLGAWADAAAIPYREANRKEITVRFSNGYGRRGGRHELALAVAVLAGSELDAAPLITHRFPLQRIGEAFRTAADRRRSQAIKVMIEP